MTTRIKNSSLADIPSEMIMQAIEDTKACELDDKYRINMRTWHGGIDKNHSESVCEVCFAGSVMAKSGRVKITKEVEPYDFNVTAKKKFKALNDLRLGDISVAFSILRITWPEESIIDEYGSNCYESLVSSYVDVAGYHENRDKFFEDMFDLACYLQFMGY